MAGGNLLGAAREFAARQRLQNQRGNETVAKQGDFFGFGMHARALLSQKHKAEGVARTRQELCVWPQAGGAAGRSAATRPWGARNAGQPSRWTRRSANRKRWAAIQPMACNMRKARLTKSDAGAGRPTPPAPRISARLAFGNGESRTGRAGRACPAARPPPRQRRACGRRSTGDQKQRDHRDSEAEIGQGELGQ